MVEISLGKVSERPWKLLGRGMTPVQEYSWMHNTSCASTLTSTPRLFILLHKRDATVPPAWQ